MTKITTEMGKPSCCMLAKVLGTCLKSFRGSLCGTATGGGRRLIPLPGRFIDLGGGAGLVFKALDGLSRDVGPVTWRTGNPFAGGVRARLCAGEMTGIGGG
jgi:hypothetical protein